MERKATRIKMQALSNIVDVKKKKNRLKGEVKKERKETMPEIVGKAQFVVTRQVKF